MFEFLNLFKKKKTNPIPTIKANAKHKRDDKRQHELFLTELESLLVSSEFFKDQYIKPYMNLYKSYKAFAGKDTSLISKEPCFTNSLTEDAQKLKKNEIKKYSGMIILLATQRAYNKVNLERLVEDKIAKEIKLIFTRDNFLCETMIKQKKKFNNKKMAISKAPIFPLTSCIRCPSCHFVVTYKPCIDGVVE